jgi:1-acyl-sn-glycerol-3-phosphate acyltransferase
MGAYYSAVRVLANTVLGVASGWDVQGVEHVPRVGGLVVASNHISFWDPPLVGSAIPREAYFLAKEELFSAPLVGGLIRSLNSIPIRRGSADLSGLARAIETLKRGGALLLFPEGSRMRDGELHPARPGLGMISVNADVPILPCCISGSDHPGRWWYRGTRVRISFGVARPWREYAGSADDLTPGRALYQRIGEAVMRDIAALKSSQHVPASRGVA